MIAEMEPCLTVEELAEKLKKSVSYIYQAAQRGEIPSFKIGAGRRFRISQVEKWLESKESITQADKVKIVMGQVKKANQ